MGGIVGGAVQAGVRVGVDRGGVRVGDHAQGVRLGWEGGDGCVEAPGWGVGVGGAQDDGDAAGGRFGERIMQPFR